MLRSTFRFIILAVLVVLSACSPSADSTTQMVPEATPQPVDTPIPPTDVPTAAPAMPAELPYTPASAVLGVEPNTTYKVDLTTSQGLPFDASELPAAPGAVAAHWYTFAGRYVVAYVGLDLTEAKPLCPGNSILTPSGFQYVSNAPTEEGGCEGLPTLTADPEVGPIVCQGTMFYVTAIPSEEQGRLFGTLEMFAGEGILVGLTSAAESSLDIPEIDLAAFCG